MKGAPDAHSTSNPPACSLKHVPMSTRYPPEWTHDPDGDNVMVPDDGVTIAETWSAMEALVEKGLVKNIGVANFPAALLLELLKTAKVKVSEKRRGAKGRIERVERAH